MTKFNESPSWEEEIELIARDERVSGGQDGVANRPLKALVNRTCYLKEQQDALDVDISGKVEAVKTFAEGATLHSPREEILNGAYRLVWTGAFPKVVPANSSPASTGGTGAGKWAYTSDAAIRTELSSESAGGGGRLVTVFRQKLLSAVKTVSQWLSTQPTCIWEYADAITDKPDINDPSTWDWSPAFNAAQADNVCVNLLDKEIYTLKTPVVIEFSEEGYADYSRLPRCRNGLAVIDYSALGNGGAGFDFGRTVYDKAQPAYEAAFTVKGLSGHVILQEFEGIIFRGNENTVAIKLIGADGVKIRGCTFARNRYGVVFNNGDAAGTYTELGVMEDCRWRGSCLAAAGYEKGNGDTSFHGSGFGDNCHITAAAGRSSIIIGEGCQPYNAPLKANIWTTGTAAPVITNLSSLPAHFYGSIKWEGSYKPVLSSGGLVYFYGEILHWAGIDKGSLRQARRGGPTSAAGGNLAFSGILDIVVTRWDIAKLGTQAVFMDYNEEATVSVSGDSYFAVFKLQTARRLTNNCTTSPFLIISGNVNPLTKFNITRTSQGLRLTTIEDNTEIVVWRQRGLPDKSSGINYTTADYWNKL